jgi:hypothetical protein
MSMCDRLNNHLLKFVRRDRYCCESWVLGDRNNNLSSKGDRYYRESWVLGDRHPVSVVGYIGRVEITDSIL